MCSAGSTFTRWSRKHPATPRCHQPSPAASRSRSASRSKSFACPSTAASIPRRRSGSPASCVRFTLRREGGTVSESDPGLTASKLSAIITCYYEERSIDEFHAKLSRALAGLGRPYEIVFVNDGSTDGTWDRLKAIFERDPSV